MKKKKEKEEVSIYRKHPDVWKLIEAAAIYRHGKKIYWFVAAIVGILIAFAIFAFVFFVPSVYKINAWAAVSVASVTLLLIMIVVLCIIRGLEAGKVRIKFKKITRRRS